MAPACTVLSGLVSSSTVGSAAIAAAAKLAAIRAIAVWTAITDARSAEGGLRGVLMCFSWFRHSCSAQQVDAGRMVRAVHLRMAVGAAAERELGRRVVQRDPGARLRVHGVRRVGRILVD